MVLVHATKRTFPSAPAPGCVFPRQAAGYLWAPVSVLAAPRQELCTGDVWLHLLICAFFSLQSWDIFFRNANAGAAPGTAYQSPPPLSSSLSTLSQAQFLVQAQPNVDKLVEDHLAVQSLIRAYQVRTQRCAGDHVVPAAPLPCNTAGQ